MLALLACLLASAAHAQEGARPRVAAALARALADPGAAAVELRRQAASPRARAGELRVIAEPPRGLRAADLPLARIRALGARVDGIARSRVRIAGSPAVLARVAELTGIGELHFPLVPVPVEGAGLHISESVALVGAAALQLAGVTGSGVEVAVLDLGFWRLTEAINTGEIPADTQTYDITGNGIETVTSHGTAVAEQVTDMAPGVNLHLIMFEDEVDFELGVDYVRDHGIRIANLSVNWFGTSYYDDTGPINDLINESHDTDGVFWAVGGGNWGFRHWRGGWLDENADGWLSFAANDDQLGFAPEALVQSCLLLNWDQYTGSPATDLDLYIYRVGFVPPVVSSQSRQSTTGKPVEQACFTPVSGQSYYARVHRFSGPTAGLDMTVISANLTLAPEHRVVASSMVDPAVAHGAFAVGAVDHLNWNLPVPTIEPLSSWGPTTDGRPKPELVAPDRTDSLTRPDVPGTSFAAPVVAGAAALLLAQNSTFTNLQLRATLIAAAQDVGAAGHDSTYGWGKLVTPVVPPGPDGDADGVQDLFDVCPFEPDPLQLDANSDGIGDACQCGDLSGDGLISSADADLLRDWLRAIPPSPSALARCNVKGPEIPLGADCRIDDWAVLERTLAGSLPPGIAQVCGPALPP
ncbi:MAG: S8 family serine peptidase [Myxococcota bacterium]